VEGVAAVPRFAVSFPGTLAGFDEAFARLRAALDQETLDAGARYRVELVFEEIVANIVRHGAPGGGAADVRFSLDLRDGSVVLTFDDDGVAFDPRGRPDPVPARSLEQAKVGGLGLMMVRRAASAIDYRRTPERRNELIVTVPAAAHRSAS
jgi:anti-sigma regulatory factor (Ser/Thr protein kinase)